MEHLKCLHVSLGISKRGCCKEVQAGVSSLDTSLCVADFTTGDGFDLNRSLVEAVSSGRSETAFDVYECISGTVDEGFLSKSARYASSPDTSLTVAEFPTVDGFCF